MPSLPPLTFDTRTRAWLAWGIICLLWGTTYLAMRISLETVGPFLIGGLRYTGAGVVLLLTLRARGERLPGPRQWPSLSLLGLLLLGVGNGGIVWAEQTVPSGLTAVLVAMTPFWMVGIDAVRPGGARLTMRRVGGLVVGFLGIVLLVWPELRGGAGPGFMGGVAAVQIACVGWALGSNYARTRGADENVLATAAFQMLFGGLWLLAAGTLHGEWALLTFTTRSAGAVLYLLVFGAVAGFTAYAYALKHLPMATVSLYAYVNPVIAVALGTLVMGEPFSVRMLVAGAIVFGGVAIVQGRA